MSWHGLFRRSYSREGGVSEMQGGSHDRTRLKPDRPNKSRMSELLLFCSVLCEAALPAQANVIPIFS